MSASVLSRLDRAMVGRNPSLEQLLQPGLAETEIRSMISEAQLQGDVGALIEIYHWRNGTDSRSRLSLRQTSPFPKSIYQFLNLHDAIEMYRTLQQAAHDLVGLTADPTGISKNIRHYFPIFWDGSDCSLGVDLAPGTRNRIVMITFAAEDPFREVYGSFEEFLQDMTIANEEDRSLKCFQV